MKYIELVTLDEKCGCVKAIKECIKLFHSGNRYLDIVD